MSTGAGPPPEADAGDLHALAAELAAEAGALLLAVRGAHEGGFRELKDAGDLASHRLLVRRLAERRPADAVLSEEGADDARRLTAERVWIVDPLDGTREYAEGRDDWAVHVACWERTRLIAGAVALPAQGLVLATPNPLGDRSAEKPADRTAHAAAPAEAPAAAPAGGPPRLVVSRTRPPPLTWPLQEALGGELVPMGSAGAKAMAVVRGLAEIYAHAGGQYEWDSAAPVAVAAAAGLHVSRIDGSPLVYNRADPWLPDLLVCVPELAAAALDAVRPHLEGAG